MIRIAAFGHDAQDAAWRRRLLGFIEAGAAVVSYSMRRHSAEAVEFDHVDLGLTRDGDLAGRAISIAGALARLAPHARALSQADLFWARNLDMLALAFAAKAAFGARAGVVYEALDVHGLLLKRTVAGQAARALEGRLLAQCRLLVTSSPAFIDRYFSDHRAAPPVLLVENRLPSGARLGSSLGPRPSAAPKRMPGPLRIGWFGMLRCKRSFDMLRHVAAALPDQVEIVMRGKPSSVALPNFLADRRGRANFKFYGPYRSPEDLATLYSEIDLMFAGEFFQDPGNSRWLLPNRLYEAGYFGAPPITFAGYESGRWARAHGIGFVLDQVTPGALAALVERLTPIDVMAARGRILSAPEDLFVQPREEPMQMLQAALRPDSIATAPPRRAASPLLQEIPEPRPYA